jgi:hypothetical protein
VRLNSSAAALRAHVSHKSLSRTHAHGVSCPSLEHFRRMAPRKSDRISALASSRQLPAVEECRNEITRGHHNWDQVLFIAWQEKLENGSRDYRLAGLDFQNSLSRSIISRLIHSPKPVPLLPFVVKKGSKMWERVEGVIPEPVSAIVRMIPFPPVAHSVPSLLRMNRWPPFGIMASIAFPTRLLSTCRISTSRHVT